MHWKYDDSVIVLKAQYIIHEDKEEWRKLPREIWKRFQST